MGDWWMNETVPFHTRVATAAQLNTSLNFRTPEVL
jgi:hypothetical protein